MRSAFVFLMCSEREHLNGLIERPSLHLLNTNKYDKRDAWMHRELRLSKDKIDIDRIISKHFMHSYGLFAPANICTTQNYLSSIGCFSTVKMRNDKKMNVLKMSNERKAKEKQRWIYDHLSHCYSIVIERFLLMCIEQLNTFSYIRHCQQLFWQGFLFPSLCQFKYFFFSLLSPMWC